MEKSANLSLKVAFVFYFPTYHLSNLEVHKSLQFTSCFHGTFALVNTVRVDLSHAH
jgi:hypothetical protein